MTMHTLALRTRPLPGALTDVTWTPLPTDGRAPLVVAYGLGVDSTAMLVGMYRRGIRPDKILFADVGGEKPETYAYLPVIQAWLAKVGFPAVEVVRYEPKHTRYTTLEGNCLANKTLPSLAFGRKSCSIKFKREPQDKHCKAWVPAQRAWAEGRQVVKAIGYDAGPKDARRSKIKDDARYTYRYFLREWGWDREECIRQIARAGLPVPVKSACFFCPSTKPEELRQLAADHPELAERIIAIEAAAAPRLTKIEGLWRKGTKGTRGGEKKPGSMTVFLRMLPTQTTTAPACSAACF